MDAAIALVCERFGITKVKVEQRQGIEAVISGHDVFGCFPTGFGKSLIYQALPTVAKALRGDCFETPPLETILSSRACQCERSDVTASTMCNLITTKEPPLSTKLPRLRSHALARAAQSGFPTLVFPLAYS